MTLTPLAQMLTESESVEIELSRIDPFPEHPFRVQADEDMERLIESIQESGVMVPVILRRWKDGRYQTVAGHRRCYACRQLQMERIPAVIKEITDEEAVIWMIDSNVQRTNILPSEKAKAYQMKMDALAKQGKREDLSDNLTSRQSVGKWRKETAEQVGLGTGDSGRKVQRYLRLNHLLPELLEKVDNKKLPFLSGVELSYIPSEQQKEIVRYLSEHPHSITVKQAGELRKQAEISCLTLKMVEEVLKPKAKEEASKKGAEKTQEEDAKKASGKSTEKVSGKSAGKTPQKVQESQTVTLEFFAEYFPKGSKPAYRKKVILALLEKWKKGEIQI